MGCSVSRRCEEDLKNADLHPEPDPPPQNDGVERHLDRHFAAVRREGRLAAWGWALILGMIALGIALSLTKYSPNLKHHTPVEEQTF